MNTRTLTSLVAVGALALAACGGDDDDDADTSATSAAVETSEPVETSASTASTASAGPTGPTATQPDGEAPDTATATSSADAGVAFTGADYTITFPVEPETETQQGTTASGDQVDVLVHLASVGDAGFVVAEIDVPTGEPYDLEAGRDGAITGIAGTLVSTKAVELDGVPGVEFSAAVTSGGVDGSYVSRLYSDQHRVWQIAVTAPGTFDATDPDVVAFFDSFQLTGAS